MGYFCPKNTFIQIKHNIQRIYPSLLSTTCVTIHQMTYVISETISHFSRHSPSIFFSSNITYFLAKQPIKVKIFRLATARIKTDQVPHVICLGFIQILHQCSVSSKITPLYFFSAQTSYTLDKNSPPKWNFRTFEWSGKNSQNSSCHI